MKLLASFILISALVLAAQLSFAELDLDKPVIVIPKTHDVKPYIWHVRRNPEGYALSVDHSDAIAGLDTRFSLDLKVPASETIAKIHVFITDKGLDTFKHLRLTRNAAGYFTFDYAAPWRGDYRMEVVFESTSGWVDLSKDMNFAGPDSKHDDIAGKNVGYGLKITLYPKEFYAKHVGTILFKLSYNGKLLKGLELTDGADMEVASWDENFREFLFVLSKQKTGGPDVPVSIAFMEPGRHAIFAEFKHNGKVMRIDAVINSLKEITHMSLPVSPLPAD